jgi:uncharacterized repeat protein (TIGR01451 family)
MFRTKRIDQYGFLFLWIVLLFFCLSGTASAADHPRITLSTIAEKEVNIEKDGKMVVERIPLENASLGDTIIYTITYRNDGEALAQEVIINDPIPEGTVYILNSAEGSDSEISFSIDGGLRYSKPPIRYLVKRADGTQEETEAPAEVYTHVKWVINKAVLPGQSGQVSFKVSVK